MQKLLFCLIFFGTILAVTACGDEGGTKRARGRLQVQESGDTIEVRSPDGSVLIKGNQKNALIAIKAENGEEVKMDFSTDKLADDFPVDIPVLPESTVSMNQVFLGGRNAIATLTTNETPEKVIRFYEEQIPLKGWKPGSRFDLDNIVMLNGTRGNASLNISITTEAEKTTINMARTESEQ